MFRPAAMLGLLIFIVSALASAHLLTGSDEDEDAPRRAGVREVTSIATEAAAPSTIEATRALEDPSSPEAGADESLEGEVEITDDDGLETLVVVHGRVVNVVDGSPIPYAIIDVVVDDERRATTTADGAGVFQCHSAEGSELLATAPGFDVQQADVAWHVDEPEREVEISLSPAGSVLGRVLIPRCIEAIEVKVRIDVEEIVRGEYPETLEREVAPDGSFRFDDVPLGSLVVVDAYVMERAFGRSLPLLLPDEAGARATTVVDLRARSALHVVVAYPDGTPAADWCVALKRVDDGEEYSFAHRVEDDGTISFTDLPAGEFEIRACCRLDDEPEVGERLQLVAGGERTIRMVVDRGLSITGKLIRALPDRRSSYCCAPEPVHVSIERGDELRWSLPIRSDDGVFRFEHVPAGEWRLRWRDDSRMVTAGQTGIVVRESAPASLRGTVRLPEGSVAEAFIGMVVDEELVESTRGTSFRFDVAPAASATILVVAHGLRPLIIEGIPARSGADQDLGELRVERDAALFGVVLDADDAPVPNSRVSTFVPGWPNPLENEIPGMAWTDEEGRFDIPVDPDSQDLWIDTDFGGVTIDVAERAATKPEAPIVIRLPPTRVVRGRVVVADQRDVDGIEVPWIEVYARRPRPWPGRGSDSSGTQTDENGDFEIHVLEGGPWTLEAAGHLIGAGCGTRTIMIDGPELDVGTIVLRR